MSIDGSVEYLMTAAGCLIAMAGLVVAALAIRKARRVAAGVSVQARRVSFVRAGWQGVGTLLFPWSSEGGLVSDPSNPAAPTAGARPSSVTISSYLLYAVAAIQVIGLILALSFVGKTQQVYKEVYAGTSAESAASFGVVGTVIGAVIGLLLAVGLVVLATLNNRGKNVSRIVTWAVGGIGVCCIGGSLGLGALTSTMNTGSGDVPSAAEVQRRLDEVLPSWYGPVSTTLTVLSLIALLAALILLALPASNEYFRKPPAAGWEQPVPGATYPGYPQSAPPAGQQGGPGYPPTPGYPQSAPPTGQQGDPGYPQTPGHPPANP